MYGVSGAQQQGFQVFRGSTFTISCSIQPQYPGGSFLLSSSTHNYTQPADSSSESRLLSVIVTGELLEFTVGTERDAPQENAGVFHHIQNLYHPSGRPAADSAAGAAGDRRTYFYCKVRKHVVVPLTE
ncbi:hypothetical protein KUCAC02_036047 [Chaenocephalus aceratus]|nr:hypothetical protein KUCAC02_036047 [Chaenocephalus aceratus]